MAVWDLYFDFVHGLCYKTADGQTYGDTEFIRKIIISSYEDLSGDVIDCDSVLGTQIRCQIQ